MTVSIIIPTYNNKNDLEKTIHSIINQSVDTSNIEVIICDDGSSDGTKAMCLKFQNMINIRYLYQEDQGFRAAKARNMGLEAAQGEFILFIDSGVLIKSDLIETHLSNYDDATINIGFCHGFDEHSVMNNDFESHIAMNQFDTLFMNLLNDENNHDCRFKLLTHLGHFRGFEQYPWLFFWGGHLFGKKEHFLQVGGFDEKFTHWGGEDVELGLRLHLSGIKMSLNLDAHAYHIPHKKADTASKESTVNNCFYIHNKHQLDITHTMTQKTWEEIVAEVD